MSAFKEIFAMVNWKDVWVRTIKTAWQAALGVFIAIVPTLATATGDTWKGIVLGFLASLVSATATAVWNGVLSPVLTAWKDGLSGPGPTKQA